MPDIETLIPFATIAQQITAKQDISLNANLAGQTAIDRFQEEISKETCILTNCTVIEITDTYLYFSGTFKSLLSCPTIKTEILLFDGTTDPDNPDVVSKRNGVMFLHFPGTFTPDALLQHFQPPANVAVDISSFIKLVFSDKDAPVLFFSSTDYRQDFTHYPAAFEAIKPWKTVTKGTHCNLAVTTNSDIQSVLDFLSIPGSFNVVGNIDGAARALSLAYPLNISKTLGPFGLTLKSIDLDINLDSIGITLPAIGLSAHIDFGIGTSDLEICIDISNKEMTFVAQDMHFAMDALDTFAQKFAGTTLSNIIPGSVSDYGIFYAVYMQSVISLEDGHVREIAFQLTTEKPLSLLGDVIMLTPYFTFDVLEPFDSGNRDVSIRIDGAWQLGNSFFDLAIQNTYSNGKSDFFVTGALRPGQILDIGALTSKIVGQDVIPSGLAIADFELEASVHDGTLDLSLDVLSDWELTLGGSTFAIQEIDFSLSYAHKQVTDAAILGRLILFNYAFAVSGEYDKDGGWVISGGLAPGEKLVVSELIVNVVQTFKGVQPSSLLDDVKQYVGDITVESLLVAYAAKQNSISVYLALANVLDVPYLTISKVIASVDVTDSVLTGNCMINLQIAGVDVFLNTEKNKDGLIFSGGLPANTTLPAGALVEDLFAKFTGVKLPTFLSSIVVTVLTIRYNTTNKDYAFSIKGSMKIGTSTPVISLDTSMVHAADNTYTQKINASITTQTSLADMAMAFGFNGTAIPKVLQDLVFAGVTFNYDSSTGITQYTGAGAITIEGETAQLKLVTTQSTNKASYAGDFTWLPDPDNKNTGLNFHLESTKDGGSSSLALTLVFTIKGVKINMKASSTDKDNDGVKISDKQFSGGTNNLNLSVTDVLDDLLKYIYPDYKDVIPISFLPDIVIEDVFINYTGKTKQTDLAALVTVAGKEVNIFFQYQSKSDTTDSRYVFGISADIADLSQLPLVGGELKEVSLNGAGFVYTSGDGDYFIPVLDNSTDSKLVIPRTAKTFGKGFNLIGEINLPGQDPFSLSLPQSGVQSAVAAAAAAPVPVKDAEISGMVKWFKLDKKLGPVTVNKLGFAYNLNDSKKIALLVDGNLAAGGLDLGLEGMGVSILPGDLFHGKADSLSFELSGIGLTFEKGPVEISAAFVRTTQKINNQHVDVYNGGVIIKMSEFMITGIGSYAKTGDQPSLFIYGLYEGNIGGPAFFFVTGIAVGFGYNRRVNIPGINDVHQYPLVAMAMQPDSSKGILEILKLLETRDSAGNLPIEIAIGEYWLAAGIRFTSFKIIESFVLLTVNFGHDVEFAILGLSRLKWPEKSISPSPIVYIELAVLAHFGPGSDVISVQAVITPNSYLFSKDCILTGGFAFYTWVSGEHEGDFVVTLGGYHPKFQKPAHYPVVPRLSFAWKISDVLSVSGEMYYALTPTAIMAGGRMEVVFHIPVLTASLTVWADMLISWSPFQYFLDIGVCVKIDAHISIAFVSIHFSLEMDAVLHIWGPPFAGEAHVDWTIFSFTIPFGSSDRSAPLPLEWTKFAGSYIPANPINNAVTNGIIKQVKDPANTEVVKYTIVNPHEMELTIGTNIPANALFFNDKELDDTCPMRSGTGATIIRNNVEVPNTYGLREKDLGIRPCGLNVNHDLDFSLNIAVTLGGMEQTMTCTAVAKGATDALWGSDIRNTDNNNPGTAKVVGNVLSGLIVRPPLQQQVSSIRELDFSQLFDLSQAVIVWSQVMADTGKAYHSYDVFNIIKDSYTDKGVAVQRNNLLDIFSKTTGLELDVDTVDMNTIMTSPDLYFKAPPVLCHTGEIPQYPTDTQ